MSRLSIACLTDLVSRRSMNLITRYQGGNEDLLDMKATPFIGPSRSIGAVRIPA